MSFGEVWDIFAEILTVKPLVMYSLLNRISLLLYHDSFSLWPTWLFWHVILHRHFFWWNKWNVHNWFATILYVYVLCPVTEVCEKIFHSFVRTSHRCTHFRTSTMIFIYSFSITFKLNTLRTEKDTLQDTCSLFLEMWLTIWQCCFTQWFGAIGHYIITRTNIVLVLCSHMASLGPCEFKGRGVI